METAKNVPVDPDYRMIVSELKKLYDDAPRYGYIQLSMTFVNGSLTRIERNRGESVRASEVSR